MSFEHLDDAMAPAPDDARWQRIGARARQRRRRTRLVVASASVLTLVVAGTAVALAARSPEHRVRVVSTPSSTGVARPSSSTSTTGAARPTDPNVWVTVELHLDATTVQQGDDVTGTVVFHNWTGHDVALSKQCDAPWAVAAGTGSARPEVLFRLACYPPRRYAAGTTREAYTARTTYLRCTGRGGIGAEPHCLANGDLPRLPTGAAQVWFVTFGPVAHLQVPAPTPITIVAAGTPEVDTVIVPDVVGMPQQRAARALEAVGLVVRIEFAGCGTSAPRVVVRQAPNSARSVTRGSVVTLTVAITPSPGTPSRSCPPR